MQKTYNLKLPIISDELFNYLNNLLGKKVSKKYLKSIITPMEKYTLHIFKNYEEVDVILKKLHEHEYKAHVNKRFQNLIEVKPKGPFKLIIEEELKEIVVDNIASEMIYQGADVFIPGIKRANKVKKKDQVKIVSQEQILVAKAKALMSHNEILSKKRGIAAKNTLSPYRVPSLLELQMENEPLFFQSFPAYLAALNIDPGSEDKILDCCSAPGNKTIHLHELSGGKSKIVAVDRSNNRLQKLNERIKKFKLHNINTFKGDIIEMSKNWQVKFDKVLVDPPCTALGLRPRLHLKISHKIIKESAKYQKKILKACSKMLKNKGILVYSTCTITKEENEDVIEHIISNSDLKLVEQEFQYGNTYLNQSQIQKGIQRFIPGIDKTVGFFIAKLQKK
ncbi:MAG: RsmB/NOP family class I SAM-dependent RNA methyltransferase [Candidatus Heimdallarchaeum aukensis]|uniref:RsmB/NOP family class I SAM-dependent RNA methyltransferase n=1 Tax=Candidatus Heimdallarchaeum aukensis TaxID=2876573 RepID=A0A9Y1BJ47_9ARCH|nr:MAG: RsmB/NOP family class I SAM-dependent RNA methyltransferase [Candidatus Heimdallarchaeum aukensis]